MRFGQSSRYLLIHLGEIRDANGFRLASVHCRDDLQRWSFGHNHLTSDEARRIANAIARLPELLMLRRGFYPRGGGHDLWKPSRPYHVALEDSYNRRVFLCPKE